MTPDTATPTTSTSTTDAPRAQEKRLNPWGKPAITVAVSNKLGTSQTIRDETRAAIAYWNDNADETPHDVELVFSPDEPNPDVEIVLVDHIDDCGDYHANTSFTGCADLVRPGDSIDRTLTVAIAAGYTNASTEQTIAHELGHVLGLEHGDGPGNIMAASAAKAPRRDEAAKGSGSAWYWSDVRVYVDSSNVSDARGGRLGKATEKAFSYFERGADGHAPDYLDVVITDDVSRATVVVSVVDEPHCRKGSGSCHTLHGINTEGETGLDYYTEQRIELHDVDTDAWAWHIAWAFNAALGATETDEFAPPLRDADYEERRGEWWR